MPPLETIQLIFHHDDPDGGLAALALRRAVLERTGRLLPLCHADYHGGVVNDLHGLHVSNPGFYTVDVRLFPGTPGMDHHDSSRAWFDPALHILDLTALSCFSLMLDTVGGREIWSAGLVQHIDWMDSGAYPTAELATGLDQLGQQFLAVYNQVPHETTLAELWLAPDAAAYVSRHPVQLEAALRLDATLRSDMQRRGRLEGRVVVWDSTPLEQEGLSSRSVNPFLLCVLFPSADYTIRLRRDGHMTIGHNPWGRPTAHIGDLCEQLVDPVTGRRGGGKVQVGGAPANAATLQQAMLILNSP